MSVGIQSPVTSAELIDQLGVAADRIRHRPLPGAATEADVEHYEPRLAMLLGYFPLSYLEQNHTGVVHGSESSRRFCAGQIRYPDVAFVAHDRLPGRRLTHKPITSSVPNLAVEIKSKSNTSQEMLNKTDVYFASDDELVWYVYSSTPKVDVYTSPDDVTTLTVGDSIDGQHVLPNFTLSIRKWFEKAD